MKHLLIIIFLGITSLNAQETMESDTIWTRVLLAMNDLRFSPDGTRVITSTNTHIFVYDTETGDLIYEVTGEELAPDLKYLVTDVQMSADNTYLIDRLLGKIVMSTNEHLPLKAYSDIEYCPENGLYYGASSPQYINGGNVPHSTIDIVDYDNMEVLNSIQLRLQIGNELITIIPEEVEVSSNGEWLAVSGHYVNDVADSYFLLYNLTNETINLQKSIYGGGQWSFTNFSFDNLDENIILKSAQGITVFNLSENKFIRSINQNDIGAFKKYDSFILASEFSSGFLNIYDYMNSELLYTDRSILVAGLISIRDGKLLIRHSAGLGVYNFESILFKTTVKDNTYSPKIEYGNGYINIKNSNNLSLYDLQGNDLSHLIESNRVITSNLTPGAYFLVIRENNYEKVIKFFVAE